MTNTKIGIVILNYNGARDTLECLKSISLSKLKDLRVYVEIIDNGSSETNFHLLKNSLSEQGYFSRAQKIKVNLSRNEMNLGFTGGNNIGIKNLLGKKVFAILLLNNDTVVEKDAIKKMTMVLLQRKNIGMVAPKIYFFPGYEFHKERYSQADLGKVIWFAGGMIDWQNVYFSHRGVDEIDRGQYDSPAPTDYVSGCAMMVKTEALGFDLFDDRYFLYLEDVDLSMRFKKKGYVLYYEPKAVVWHKNASSSDSPGSALHVYYQTRNRLLFGYIYAGLRTKAALFKESLLMILKDKQRRVSVLDYYSGRLNKKSS